MPDRLPVPVRRRLLVALAAAGLPVPTAAAAREAFRLTGTDEVLSSLGVRAPAVSDALVLTAPDVAEDGFFVQVTVASRLPDVRRLALVAAANPQPLVALLHPAPDVVTELGLRIRLARDGELLLLADTPAGWFGTRRTVRVIQGGCGA